MHTKPFHVLISPLDWGLGHASRCIPIIRQLIVVGHRVTIAGFGRSLALLQKEFPQLESIELKGFSPSYSEHGNTILHLFLLLPKFVATIFLEHYTLKKLISHYKFDIIISDNRYGLWNKKVKNILITHQVMIKTPSWLRFGEYLIYRISCLMIGRFDECWIPDYKESPGLSGDLSHKYPVPGNAKYIGPLSRFQQSEKDPVNTHGEGEILAIVSGPEPQRSIFEDILIKHLSGLNQPSTIITGKPELTETRVLNGTLTITPHVSVGEMSSLITSSSIVICRSGYSSIMDLHALGAKALFVPTPGQTEQLYLAEFHHKAGITMWKLQEQLNIKVDVADALNYTGFKVKSPFTQDMAAAVANLKKK